ncbi:hypothetical protein AAVH_30422 [Aphelenchoides avenae]|nr:hypothetical protein AAVH_30422 [Aphelenchus avenae]
MPQFLAQPQITAPPCDARDFQLVMMRAEVQRLMADNEVRGCGWRMAEQACDKLRKELEELKKTFKATTGSRDWSRTSWQVPLTAVR